MQVTTIFSSEIPENHFESLKKESQSYKIEKFDDQKIFAIVSPAQKSEKSKKTNVGQENVVCLYGKFIGGMLFNQMATGKTTPLDEDKQKDFAQAEIYIPKGKDELEDKPEKEESSLRTVTTKYYLGEYLSVVDIVSLFNLSEKDFITNCKLFSRFKTHQDRFHSVRNRIFRHHLIVNEQWVYIDTAIQVLSVMRPDILEHIKSKSFAIFDRPSNYRLEEKGKKTVEYDYHIFAVKHTKPKPRAKNQEISYSMKELKNEEDIKQFDPSYVIKIYKDKSVKKITAIAIKRILGGEQITPKMTAKEETKIIPKTREEFIQKIGLVVKETANDPNDIIYTSQKLYEAIKQSEAETAERRKANKGTKDSEKKPKGDTTFNAVAQKGIDVEVEIVPEDQPSIAEEVHEEDQNQENEYEEIEYEGDQNPDDEYEYEEEYEYVEEDI